MGEKIRDGIQAGLDSKQIATIMRDVPIDFDLESLTRQSDDEAKLADFYRRYDMYSLLKKMTLDRVLSQLSACQSGPSTDKRLYFGCRCL